MVFTTELFLYFFFPICMISYYIILLIYKIPAIKSKNGKMQLANIAILMFSCVFYIRSNFANFLILFSYIIVIFLMGHFIFTLKDLNYNLPQKGGKHRHNAILNIPQTALIIAVIIALIWLVAYKYLGNMLQLIIPEGQAKRNYMVPLGISFITFSAISYLVDIYRKDAPAGTFWDCAGYLLFFPKIVSGPIVQWKDFYPQLENHNVTQELSITGINRIMAGFAKKLILADTFGRCIAGMGNFAVDNITAIASIILYMLQIYYDFSGYSDIALGLSNILGFDFKVNFNFPYRACSITEFWRRWHISLGTWFKEYVYIPLGGSRTGLKNTLRNLFIVFCLTGIWHGFGISYLLWGLINAGMIILERVLMTKQVYQKIPKAVRYIVTMLVVMCFWQLFRFESLKDTLRLFLRIFGTLKPGGKIYTWQYYLDWEVATLAIVGIFGATIMGSPVIINKWKNFSSKKIGFMIQEITLLILFCISIIYMVNSSYHPFIYFQY